jgi:hypothetical protein
MTNDPNVPPYQPNPEQPPQPFGPYPPQQAYGSNDQAPRQFQQAPYYPQMYGAPPQFPHPQPGPQKPKGPFGVSFWIVAGILTLLVLSNSLTGHGESILIILGIAAVLTGLYSLIFKKRSWAALPNRNFAIAVAVAGATALVFGGIAAGVDSGRGQPVVQAAAEPVTSADLEADAAARLKAREDALVKSEAESAAKLATREEAVKKAEEAVKARETAVGGAEAAAAANTIAEGIWTVGKDIVPGDYRTTKAVMGGCSWKITRTGSNGSDYIDYDFFVKGGFPMVTLVEGQTFETGGCGSWTKQ